MNRIHLLLKQCARLRSKLHGTRKDVVRAVSVQNELRAELARANQRIAEMESCFTVRLRENHESRSHVACIELTPTALKHAKMEGKTPELFGYVTHELLGHFRRERR